MDDVERDTRRARKIEREMDSQTNNTILADMITK